MRSAGPALRAGFLVAFALLAASGPAIAGLAVFESSIGANEGPFFGSLTSFTDSDTSRTASDYTVTIRWSDDNTISAGTIMGGIGSFTVSGSHFLVDEGYDEAYVTVTVNATMETATNGVQIKISDADSLTGTPVQLSATVGVSFTTVVATFTDSYTGNQPSDFTSYISWGDGTDTDNPQITSSGGSYSVSGTHTYTQAGTFDVGVSLADLASFGTQTAVTSVATVTAPASPGRLQFSNASYSAAETAGSTTITVDRSGGSSGAVGVSYATSDGTGVAGRDYTPVSGTLSWASGDTAPKTFTVPLLGDPFLAASETVNLALANPTGGAALASPSTAVLTIADRSCDPSDLALCLNNGRFRVQATWQTSGSGGTGGSGHVLPLTDSTGAFWFFDPANVELIVKVLTGCAVDGHYWVFAGGLTNISVKLAVTDTQTGVSRSYTNQQGIAFQPIQDVNAFPTCP